MLFRSYREGGFPLRDNGQPDYNDMPTYLANPFHQYTKAFDQTFTSEEQAVAEAGDSCYKAAGY